MIMPLNTLLNDIYKFYILPKLLNHFLDQLFQYINIHFSNFYVVLLKFVSSKMKNQTSCF